MTTRELLLAALVGAIAGAATNVLLSIIRRRVNDWRLARFRICRACKGLRVIDGHIVHKGEAIEINVPCPVCNPAGRFPRTKPGINPDKPWPRI